MERLQNNPAEAPSPLRAAANDILGEAKSALATAPATEATRTIHDFRVAMKRWRAFLRLVEPLIGDEARELRRQASTLARGLSQSRDAQAASDAFADVVKAVTRTDAKSGAKKRTGNGTESGTTEDGVSDTVRKAVDRKLVSLRDAAEGIAFDRAAEARLTEAMLHAEREVAKWPLETIGFEEVATELARSYRRARRRRPSDWSAATDEDLHELRKAVVTLRYQIEIVEVLWPRMLRLLASELQRLRTQLGKANDLAVLGELSRPRAPLARWRKHFAEAAAARRVRHTERAQRIAGRVFSETPRAFRRRLLALWEAAQPRQAQTP